jgi:YidC/Oxa1 family membrane protein insertase
MISAFHHIVYLPLYNTLIFVLAAIPGADVGLAVILLTLLIKSILYPISHKGLHTQRRMKEVEPKLNELKEKHKKDKQELAKKTMELYKEENINPFSGILLLIIQVPVLIGLYLVFMRGGLPTIDPRALYSFIVPPHTVGMHLLGLFDLSKKNLILALFAGLAQFARARVAPVPTPPVLTEGEKPSFQQDFARSMNIQMRYILPVFIAFFAYNAGGALALYWITSNIFDIGTELLVTRRMKKNTN